MRIPPKMLLGSHSPGDRSNRGTWTILGIGPLVSDEIRSLEDEITLRSPRRLEKEKRTAYPLNANLPKQRRLVYRRTRITRYTYDSQTLYKTCLLLSLWMFGN